MSKDKHAPKPDKKKGGLLKIALLVVVLLAGAGGGAFALVKFGVMGSAAEARDNAPRLLKKGEEDPYSAPAEGGGEEKGAAMVHGEGGDEYRVSYFTFADDFTSNLKDSDALVQATLAASTRRDGRVLMWLKEHELALRSQILVDLADTPEEELRSPQGKDRVQKRLTASINRILTESEGFGGVDQVYFRSLIIQ